MPKLDPTKGKAHKEFKLRQQEQHRRQQQQQQCGPTEADLQALETVFFTGNEGGVAMLEQRSNSSQ